MKHRILLDTPAADWDTALPLGNGRLGALVRGIPGQEIIHLNEETLWYGGPVDRTSPQATEYVPKIRAMLREGNIEDANYYARIGMYSSPEYLSPYHPAAELRLQLRRHQGEVTDYKRWLSLDDAVATVEYKVDGIWWKLEYIASRQDNVIALHITCQEPISLAANLTRRPFEEFSAGLDSNTSGLWGQSGADGVHYFGALRLQTDGGTSEVVNDFVVAENATSVTLYTSFSTDFNKNVTFRRDTLKRLDTAEAKGYEQLKKEHMADYHALYRRMHFSLGTTSPTELPTDALLESILETEDMLAELTETLFHFGRYLLISGSTDCQLPANLQGIWNGSYTPPWESKYTININIQMNYWLAGLCQLNECHLPLFDLVDRMVVRGQKTARNLYDCDGFVAHHNTNLWADTDPEGIFGPSPIWPMGGAWFALHYFDYYDYTGDQIFLERRALPVLEQSVLFYSQYMIENESGHLVTGPSLSPENTYRTADGSTGAICMGPTMDIQIVRQLLQSYCSACAVLNITPALLSTAKEMLHKLPPTRLQSDGRIMEWQEEYEEVEPGHRHVSHLFGLYPGDQITEATPQLMEGALKTLETRLAHGGAHTGWSRVWLICMMARLKEGEEAYHHLHELFKHSIMINLFNSHPPYQIDGNYGFTAAVVEMIVQSHNQRLEIFPALPAAWDSGELLGVGLRGGIVADLRWENSALTSLTLTATAATEIPVRYQGQEILVPLAENTPTPVVFR